MFQLCQKIEHRAQQAPNKWIDEISSKMKVSWKYKIHCVLLLLSGRNNGRRSPDARCFDRPHSSFLLCINYVVCTVCVLVRKWMGNAIFRKDFIQFVQHYPSTSVRYMTDSTILVWRLLLLLFPAAVAAVWQKNSPLLYCLDVLRDQQKKLIHTISIPEPHWLLQNVKKKWKVLEVRKVHDISVRVS